jgi:hypothetical protein
MPTYDNPEKVDLMVEAHDVINGQWQGPVRIFEQEMIANVNEISEEDKLREAYDLLRRAVRIIAGELDHRSAAPSAPPEARPILRQVRP